MKTIISFFFYFIFLSVQAQTWQQLPNFPNAERDDGMVFIIGDKAYCGTGLAPWFSPLGDFYSFDMNTELWDTIAAMPIGMERQYASGFTSGNKGYVFGGFGSGSLNDLWMYDTTLNTWTQKTSLPGPGRNGSSCFVINDTAYIIGGFITQNVAIAEVWAYDIINDSWQQKNDLNFGGRWRASAVSMNGNGYLIFGKDENNRYCNEFYEYNPFSDSWIQISSFPGMGRTYSSMNLIGGDFYIFAGLDTFGTYLNDLWRYNFSTSNWQQLNSIPSKGRKGGMCFNNNTTLFYTTGIDSSNFRLNETWKCNNLTSISENQESKKLSLYPNPVVNECFIEVERLNANYRIEFTISDIFGKIMMNNFSEEDIIRINVSDYSKGIYFIRIHSDDWFGSIKIIKD